MYVYKGTYDTRRTIRRSINDIFSSKSDINGCSWSSIGIGSFFSHPTATISEITRGGML